MPDNDKPFVDPYDIPMPPRFHILKKAHDIINGPRRDSYGDPIESFSRIATMWSEILKVDVDPTSVAMCMIALKMCREIHEHGEDNLVDICGYAALISNMCGDDA